jgi:hypothetical protein
LNLNWKYAKNYPILIYHDDLSAVNIFNINVQLHNNLGYIPNIKWIKIDFKTPSHISTDESKYKLKSNEIWFGYYHMCNFQAYGIYETELSNYEYYLRLDSDSYILSPIDYDLFDYMKDNNLKYGYMRDEEIELDHVSIDLWKTTDQFMTDNNIDRSNISHHLKNGVWANTMFYNNFEISRVDTFRNPNYKAYYDALNSTGNIYYNRWGDAPIHWLGVRMFVPDNQIWCVNNISYQHNMWIKNLSAIPNNNGIPSTKPIIDKYVDGNSTQGRLGRFNYAWNRYLQTGLDGVNWGE